MDFVDLRVLKPHVKYSLGLHFIGILSALSLRERDLTKHAGSHAFPELSLAHKSVQEHLE